MAALTMTRLTLLGRLEESRFLDLRLALVINFGMKLVKDGIERVVDRHRP